MVRLLLVTSWPWTERAEPIRAVWHPRCWLTHCTLRRTLHNTRNIKDRWFRQTTTTVSSVRSSAVQTALCGSFQPPETTAWAYAPMRGVSACHAGLSTPTCDPWSESLASLTPTRNLSAQSHASFFDIQIDIALSTPVQEYFRGIGTAAARAQRLHCLRHIRRLAQKEWRVPELDFQWCRYVQLNQAKSVLCRFVHESRLHVATQLFVEQLRKILGIKDCGFRKDAAIPTAVETTQLLKILHVFGHRCCSQRRAWGRTRSRTDCRNNARATRAPQQEWLSR